MTQTTDIESEALKCESSAAYFIHNYCVLKVSGGKVPFRLWPAQSEALKALVLYALLVLLKARQIGMTTLVVCYAVWLATFKPGSTILLFSKSHKEAKDLLKRIRWTLTNLPDWLQPASFNVDATHELELSNGSRFISFGSMSSGGDSYTADFVIVDEADLVRDLDALLSGAKPTIDNGGKLAMLSRVDKSKPDSPFKRVYRSAIEGQASEEGSYHPIFLPWWTRPGRDVNWFKRVKAEIERRTGAIDELYANYPETPEQALAGRIQDKRLPMIWLEAAYEPLKPLSLKATPFPGWHGLEIYKLPEQGEEYICGEDVAWGNPNSDDSVCMVLKKRNLEECAVLCGKIEPKVHANRSFELGQWYNRAVHNPERNGAHGLKCIDELRRLKANVLKGRDNKPGWWTDDLGKGIEYDNVAEYLRTAYEEVQATGTQDTITIHSKATLDQLASLDVAELAAPFGYHDDRAMAFGLAVQGACGKTKRADFIVLTGEADAPAVAQAEETPGVKWIATYGEWAAYRPDGSCIGTFPTQELAIEAREKA